GVRRDGGYSSLLDSIAVSLNVVGPVGDNRYGVFLSGGTYVPCTAALPVWVVVVVLEFIAGANTCGFEVVDSLVVVVSVTRVLGAQPASKRIAIPTQMATAELVVYFIVQAPVYFVLDKIR